MMQEEPRESGREDIGHDSSRKALLERSNSTALSPLYKDPVVEPGRDEDELQLVLLWRVLLKRKWTVLTFLLIVIATAITATQLMTRIYQASGTLQIEREIVKVVETGSLVPNEPGNDADFYQTQYELLRSRKLAGEVLKNLSPEEIKTFTETIKPPVWQPLVQWLKSMLGSTPPQPTENAPQLDLVPFFLRALTIEPIRNSQLVKIYFDVPEHPELAAKIVNTYAAAFIQMNLERRFEATAYARKFLEERIEQTKANLERSEKDLVKFASSKQIVNLDDSQSLISQTLEQTAAALVRAEEQRIQSEARYRQMQAQGGQGLTEILASPVIQEFKAMQARLEAEYQDNLRLFKPAYPKMQQLQGQIREVNSKINAEVANIRASIRAEYEAARANEDLLRQKVRQIEKDMLGLQDRSIDYNILKRDLDTHRQLYEGLLQRYKEVGVAGGVDLNNISIVDKAETPAFAYKPNLKLNLMLAIVLGTLGGIGLAFLFEHLDDTIKSPEDLERLVGLPTLGIIPAVKETRDRSAEPLAIAAYRDPRSAFAEAYRSVRTALQFSTPEGPPRVLSVTSSVAGEGKSTTSLSLAVHFAQAGKTVLLIDADLRNPSLYRTLKLDNSFGLTNYLAGGASPADIAKEYPAIPHLSVVPSGPLPPNPAELLSTPKMLSLLVSSAEKYDQVIIDCPPVLGLADALVLGNMSEGTLLVVEAGSTRRGFIQGSLKRLRSSRTRVLGGILTKIDTQTSAYGYQQSYYYYYHESQSTTKRLT